MGELIRFPQPLGEHVIPLRVPEVLRGHSPRRVEIGIFPSRPDLHFDYDIAGENPQDQSIGDVVAHTLSEGGTVRLRVEEPSPGDSVCVTYASRVRRGMPPCVLMYSYTPKGWVEARRGIQFNVAEGPDL